nr:monovalent cation/H(+) antiporter subunit G [Sedimentibacter sp.]
MLINIVGGVFILGGLFFFLVGTIGIIRFPDVFSRIHAAAKCDTLGALLCLIGLIVFNGFNVVSLKMLLVLVFIWVTNPTASHLIGKAEFIRTNLQNKQDGVK